ncbi:TPA: DNA polymerase II [Candidatus Woesearchaeota archaeon]|nr:DNA polymerase [archaeon GW2011_AR15]MBS3103393.1 DNA polymerase II [Candidatus Woesearchaeota archaeon]HIH41510.1 DNA polymerase II [Candidatus Woesearchaeota archaeon]
MKGFIVYPTYRIIDGKAHVYLFGRLENGESFLTISKFRPYFYIREKDRKKLEKLDIDIIYDVDPSEMKNFFEEPVVKITLDVPRDVPILRDVFHKKDILTYEADIRFVYRFMIDKGIKGSLEIEGKHKKGNYVSRIYEEPELKPAGWKPELRVLALDVESSMDLKKLYSISLYCRDFGKVLLVSEKNLKNTESFKTEKEVLERFKEIISNYDPDIITGWNLIDFDLKMIKEKFDEHKIDFVLGRAEWPGSIKIYNSFFKSSTAEIPGRVALDAIDLLKTSFIGLRDYKLQTAAAAILKESKLEVFDNVDKGAEIERLYEKEPQKLADYNLKDSELVIKILEKKGIIDLIIQRSLLTGMQLDRVKASIASLDNLYLRETFERGYVCRTSEFRERGERIIGGYVRDSIPGIYDYIIVLDFKSLYPSIMRTFNIDPLSFIPKEMHGKYRESQVITAPNGAKFRRKYGILPQILQRLWEQRDHAKKDKNAEQSYAIKITMNSFFGVLANPMCRFYSLDMANAITHFGQFIVKSTAEIVDNHGYRVIYGDTDSIFVETKADKAEGAAKVGAEIQALVNEHWKKYVAKLKMDNFLELEFEKTYTRFMMPTIRGTEKGAKKRYAGLLMKDGKEKIDFTGLEFVRRDWTDLSKKFQLELLDKVFHKQEVVDYIKKFVDELKKGKYDNLLVYRKAIRKDLSKYIKTTPPHVKAARKLKKITSNIISYVMTSDGPEPVQKIEHKLDYEHYIEKQIKPIADAILVFYNTKFDDILVDTKQTSLFGY